MHNKKLQIWSHPYLVNSGVTKYTTFSFSLILHFGEAQTELKIFALRKLDLIVHEFWAEISDVVDKM